MRIHKAYILHVVKQGLNPSTTKIAHCTRTLQYLWYLSISRRGERLLECWCTGAPHAGVETGVPLRPWTGVTDHREVVLLSTKTEDEKDDKKS